MIMYNGNVGSVGGNGDEAWYKQLAKILDRADGTEDGKINANIWNGFLDPHKKSNANGIKRFINLKRAEISFKYYKSTKDVNNDKVDWTNWKEMLYVYLKDNNKDDLIREYNLAPASTGADETTGSNSPNPQVTSGGQVTDEARQAEFNAAMNQSKIKDLKKFGQGELTNLIEGFEPGVIPDDAPDCAELYENTKTGERIAVSPNPDGHTGLLVYQKDGLTHKIVFEKDSGKLLSGEITTTQADGNEKTYKYTYDESGNVKLEAQADEVAGQQTQVTSTEPPTQEDLKEQVASLPIGKDKMPTEDELRAAGYVENTDQGSLNGGKKFVKANTGEEVILTPSENSIIYTNSNVKIEQSYDDDGKPNGGRVAMISAPGTFSTGTFQKDNNGNMNVELKQSHTMPSSPKEFALEGIKGHSKNIEAFRNSIGIPDSVIIRLNDLPGDVTSKKVTSSDEKYKIKLEIDQNGNIKITYSEKQSDGTYNTIGEIEINKTTETGNLRGYDYSFKTKDYKKDSENTISNASWDDFA